MTKILVTGDWHLCMRNLEACHEVVNQSVSLLRQHQPCHFLHLGDIVGDRGPSNPQDVRVTNFLIEAVARIKEKAESFMFIRGNHDMIAGPDGVPSCCPLLKQCGVDVMADTDWNSSHLGRLHIFMVPYFRDTARQKRAFRDAWTEMTEGPKSMTTILAFHNEIKGCERNAASKGEGLTLEDIGAADYDLCVAGHIHRPQFVTPNVYFVGSPFSADWGDVNQSKRQLLVEI